MNLEEQKIALDQLVSQMRSDSELCPRLSKYRLERVLGRGSMGTVFQATDMLLKRRVALKIFPQRFTDGHETAEVEKFIQEASAAARVESNHVVRIYEINRSGGWVFIAMELVDGANLREVLNESKRVPIRQACSLIADAAEGLAQAHRTGVIHRDVKPANLVLTSQGQCKVADFGIAAATDQDDDASHEPVGTPYYIAPEVALKKPATSASDIYSLGATLWHLLEGQPLYGGETSREVILKHLKGPKPDFRQRIPELPDGLVATLGMMLARDPAKRCSDADEIASRLRTVADGQADDLDVEAPLQALAQAVRSSSTVESPEPRAATSTDTARRTPRKNEQRRKKSRTPILVAGLSVGLCVVLAVAVAIVAMTQDFTTVTPPAKTSSEPAVAKPAIVQDVSPPPQITKTSEPTPSPRKTEPTAGYTDLIPGQVPTVKPKPAAKPAAKPTLAAQPKPQLKAPSPPPAPRPASPDRKADQIFTVIAMGQLYKFAEAKEEVQIGGRITIAQLNKAKTIYYMRFDGQRRQESAVTVTCTPELGQQLVKRYGKGRNGLLGQKAVVTGRLAGHRDGGLILRIKEASQFRLD